MKSSKIIETNQVNRINKKAVLIKHFSFRAFLLLLSLSLLLLSLLILLLLLLLLSLLLLFNTIYIKGTKTESTFYFS